MIDKGLLDMKKNFGRPLTEEEWERAKEFHKRISRIPEEEMRKKYYCHRGNGAARSD